MNESFLSKEKRWKKIEIPDIPVMLSNKGEIVCIPKEDEVFSTAIVGSSGNGKTLLMNRLSGSLFYQWKSNVAIMNDLSEETYKWIEPMKNNEFNEFNKVHLNQVPISSPLIYLYPNSNTLTFPSLQSNPTIKDNFKRSYIKIVLPFAEILDNLGFYLSGVSSEFKLGKSEIYINELKDSLIGCDTPAQVRETLEEELPGNKKSFMAMKIKILTAFNALMKEEILDITNPECHAYIKLKRNGEEFISNPFSVIMKAGYIPSFITSDLINKNYKSEVFSYYINSIFRDHIKDFPNEKSFLFFDELRAICERDDEPASQAIGKISARGRINNVGLVYATQFYDKIPNSVKGAKLNYCFSFAHNSSTILNEIASDFDLEREEKSKIKKLKKFQVMAMTNNKFICYLDDDRYEETKPISGRIFFPMADHKKVG